MSADQFLALVDKHPLPWHLVGGDWERHENTEAVPIEGPAAYELSDAAPAMAAAIIRLLRHPHGGRDQSGICSYCERDEAPHIGEQHADDCPLPALRASLPESLRP